MTGITAQKVIVVSGTPGAGKTSLCRELSAADPRGVHVISDTFFDFLAHKTDPSLPASDAQNRTVVKAYAAACRNYAEGGYTVYLDGVIGPWLFPLLHPVLGTFSYVLLHTPLEVAQARVAARDGDLALPDVVVRMHSQFDDTRRQFTAHVFHTEADGPEALASVAGAVREKLDSGTLDVSL